LGEHEADGLIEVVSKTLLEIIDLFLLLFGEFGFLYLLRNVGIDDLSGFALDIFGLVSTETHASHDWSIPPYVIFEEQSLLINVCNLPSEQPLQRLHLCYN
jgi:hypothetical protein